MEVCFGGGDPVDGSPSTKLPGWVKSVDHPTVSSTVVLLPAPDVPTIVGARDGGKTSLRQRAAACAVPTALPSNPVPLLPEPRLQQFKVDLSRVP
jgi:hypothetical protein